MSFSNCASIVSRMDQRDQEAVLAFLDSRLEAGVDAKEAQRLAVQDAINVLDAEFQSAEPVAPSKYAGKKVEVPVRIEDTGEVAYLTMDVDRSLDENKQRTANMLELLSCLT